MQKGFFSFAQEPQFVRAFLRSCGTTGVQLVEQLRQPNAPGYIRPLIIDLAYLCRTLLQLDKGLDDQTLSKDHLRQLSGLITPLRNDIDTFFTELKLNRISETNVSILQRQLGGHLTQLNAVRSMTRFLVPPELHLNYYVGDMVVGRSIDRNRYKVGYNSVLEESIQVKFPEWKDHAAIYEHIAMRSGGERFYDPYYIARGHKSAQEFFTLGRVFSILWARENCPGGVDEVLDECPGIVDTRLNSSWEGVYSGPYEGPTTVRCFVVVQAGARSTLCLPISAFSGSGCSQQPDQQNYGVVHRHDQDPKPRPDESGIVLPSLLIKETPQRQGPLQNKLLTAVVPAPELLPTGPLPAPARIDYRRWCEVELNVHCRNVGLVDTDALLTNVKEVHRLG